MIFREVSRLNSLLVWSIWIFILLFWAIAYNYYEKSDLDDAILFLVISGFIFFIFLILYSNKLVLIFDDLCISYSFFPYFRKSKSINYDEIRNIDIKVIDPVSDFGGWGYKKSKKYGRGFITNSDTILFVETFQGVKVSFSITEVEKIKSVLEDKKFEF